jgi:hypothetical protein
MALLTRLRGDWRYDHRLFLHGCFGVNLLQVQHGCSGLIVYSVRSAIIGSTFAAR